MAKFQIKILKQIQVIEPTIYKSWQIQAVSSFFFNQTGILEIVFFIKLQVNKWKSSEISYHSITDGLVNKFPFSSKRLQKPQNTSFIISCVMCFQVNLWT